MKKIFSLLRLVVNGFISRMVILWVLFVLLRILELVYNSVFHGLPQHLFTITLYGLLNDTISLASLSPYLLLIYCPLFLWDKRAANIGFTIVATIVCLIQAALMQYFSTTLVPLGGDLWQYSMADIKQTMGAAGGVPISALIMFIVLTALCIYLFSVLSSRIKIKIFIALPLMSVLLITAFANSGQASPALTEYNNNLALNKLYFFYRGSIEHFKPQSQDLDIYADSYIGDYEFDNKADSTVITFKYTDEANYPFLHKDETPDVLSSFIKTAGTKPNIVILLVEGLGRAFTCEGGYLGNFTPFVDSLSRHSLYWENFLSEGGRTFAVLPSILGSLPFVKNGFCELGNNMPNHLDLLSLLRHNGYHTAFYYGGDAHFDLMDVFLKHGAINEINDINTFPAGYVKMPGSNGFTWGYGDKELFRRYFETKQNITQPYLSVILTVSTHNPFLINEQDAYLKRFEARMDELKFDDARKRDARNYKYQFASILYTDDALKTFFQAYSKRSDFSNTIFLITGDHRMPEIPMANKIDRYHVPLIVFSPLLTRTAKFSSISTHFDVTPSLLAMLKKQYNIDIPTEESWIGSGLDTARNFENRHAYPIMQTKNDMVDFVDELKMLNMNDVYAIQKNMDLTPENNSELKNKLSGLFDMFKRKNDKIATGGKLIPDSIYSRYYPK